VDVIGKIELFVRRLWNDAVDKRRPATFQRMIKVAKQSTTFPIEPGVLYPLAEFMTRSGLGTWALRQARRAGMPVIRLHSRCWVRGSDFLEYVERQVRLQQQNAEPTAPTGKPIDTAALPTTSGDTADSA